MKQKNSHLLYWVFITVVIALLLRILPWPRALVGAMPQWVLMTTLFWVVVLPEWCGVTFAFMVGLMTDCVTGTVLGQHAGVFVLLSYIALKARMPLQHLPIWQQTILVGVAMTVSILIQRSIVMLTGQALPLGAGYFSVLTSAFVWPLFSMFFYRFQSQRSII